MYSAGIRPDIRLYLPSNWLAGYPANELICHRGINIYILSDQYVANDNSIRAEMHIKFFS